MRIKDLLSVFGLLLFGALLFIGFVLLEVLKDKIKHFGRSEEDRIRNYAAKVDRVRKQAIDNLQAPPQGSAEYGKPRPLSSGNISRKAGAANAASKENSYREINSVLKEDRKHDWMARQLAEEEKALRRNFSDLGALHDASCAADDLKKSHRHDNTIDSAEVR